ncbi:MAG TPA: SPOR domain-containing protein [Gammaproteobacteria bacterium]|nr:SPOR domain-containing protein [Gammaproteobacteria bacterium]
MPRDYKNTPRPGAPRKKSKNKKQSNLPGWISIAAILALGIVIGLFGPRLFGIAQHQWKRVQTHAAPQHKKTDKPKTSAKAQPEKDEPRFDFYKLLPKFQVVIPKQDKDVQTDTGKKPVETPGAYVLQVASFRDYKDADAMKARLALLGLEAHIQQVEIGDGEEWNRVRIGPISDLARLNKTRKTLAAHQIEPLLIQVDK